MGRLAGFKYREIVKILKKFGFEFRHQAAGSHEIWYNPQTNRYTTIPNHPGDIIDLNHDTSLLAFKDLVLNKKNPPYDEFEVLDILRRNGLKDTADYLHALL